MTVRAHLAEAWSIVRTSLVPTLVILLLTAAMSATTILTVGRTSRAEQDVAARIQQAGSRLLVLRDAKSTGILTPGMATILSGSSDVERVVALGAPADAVNSLIGDGGDSVALWPAVTPPDMGVRLLAGRWPNPGESIVSATAVTRLGMPSGVGSLRSGWQTYPVVGTYRARDGFEDLDRGALVRQPTATPRQLRVIATSAATAEAAQRLAVDLVGAVPVGALAVESPTTLAEVQQQVGLQINSFGRSLLLAVLLVGGLLLAVVVSSDVLSRRKDLGRRRALGATRSNVVALVMLRTAIPALVGALTGAIAAALATTWWNATPTTAFIAGTVVLTALAADVAAVPPAAIAGLSDPVLVLRTP